MARTVEVVFKGTEEALSEKTVADTLRKAFKIIGGDEELHVLGMSRLTKGQLHYTLVDSETRDKKQQELHESCRNSLGSIFDKEKFQ